MDIFYYWKDYASHLKNAGLGWLHFPRGKLAELKGRHPDYIWAFRQPARRKGDVQLLARLRWVDTPTSRLTIDKEASVIYYDPADSVLFTDADDEAKVTEMTSLMRSRFPNAFGVSFRGDARAQAMEADLLAQIRPRVATWATEPFPGSRASSLPGSCRSRSPHRRRGAASPRGGAARRSSPLRPAR
jgi:hypothetical protein